MTPLDSALSTRDESDYLQFAAVLRRQIQSGLLKPGDKLPSRREAWVQYKLHAVDLQKVHSLLDKEGLVICERDGSVHVAPYCPPPLARRRRCIKTGIVALAGEGFDQAERSSYWGHLVQGLEEGARAERLQLVRLKEHVPADHPRPDGTIMLPWDVPDPLARSPYGPVVSVLGAIPGACAVMGDDYAGVRGAMQHLISLGHTRIAYLHRFGAGTHCVAGNRKQAWIDALEEIGVEARPEWARSLPQKYKFGCSFTSGGRATMKKWLREGFLDTGCTAILAHNDNVALGVIQTLLPLGLRVPEDISVMGFDGQDLCDYVRPRQATMAVPLREIGRRAIEMLVQRLEHPEAPLQHLSLPLALEARESAAVAPDSPEHANHRNFLRLVVR